MAEKIAFPLQSVEVIAFKEINWGFCLELIQIMNRWSPKCHFEKEITTSYGSEGLLFYMPF